MEKEIKSTRKINPRDKANPVSKLLFLYMLPIFRRNYKKGLEEDDLYKTLDEHASKELGDRLESIWDKQHRKHKKWALHRSFIRLFGVEFLIIGILQLVMEILLITLIPFAIGGLVSYFDVTSIVTTKEAYMYAGLMITSLIVDVFISNHAFMAMDHMAMKMRVACCSLMYRKALRLSKNALAETTIGHIVNLLSNDVSKFDEGFALTHYTWISPVQAAIGTYLLYHIVGVSAFAGIAFLILFIPLQIYFGKRTATLRLRTALRTDERVRLMNEIVNGIQVIKMYTWEKPFAKLISIARRYEIKAIRASFFLESITFSLEMVLTKTALFITIVVYVLLGNDVNAETVYAALAIYDQLRPTMTLLFSYGISSVAEAHISMCRIQKFLSYQELPKEVFNTNTQTLCKVPRISMEYVNAKWNPDSSDNTLNDINLYIDKPLLVAIIGQVGSGKSSLFNVILKELPVCKGFLNVDGRISYACQETWLFSASIRQNILFGEPYQEDRYKTILKICALEPDLEILPYGDKTIVGEKGKILSGGQKARINLARCIYKDTDIYLLDDPLSAVDIKVGKQLYEECIKTFLSNKICLLITHQLQYLKNADKIIIVKEGSIIGEGSYDELQSSGLDFAKLLKEFNSEENENIKKIQSRQNSEMEQTIDDDEEDPEETKETMKRGSISARLYVEYLRSGGNYFIILVVSSIFIGTFAISSFGEYFISEWVNLEQKVIEENEKNQTHSNSTVNREVMIYEYCAIMLGTITLAILQSTSFFVFFMRASVNIHDSIFAKISYATMRFFNTNHTGRILNRFSKDMGVIDELLPFIIYDVMQILLYFLSAVVLTSIVNPMLLLPAAGFLVIFYLLRNIYLETSRTVKRIEGITRSPIYSHMTASVQGLSTIRASLAQDTLTKEFDDHQDLHSSAWFLYIVSNKAFAFYLQGLCAIIVLAVVLSLILTDREYYGGQAGLILTQYINIVNVLEWGMRGWSNLENNMTSVERVFEYKNVETEPVRKELSVLSREWPEFGKIVFQNVSMKYNSEDIAVLKNLNFTINSKEKVGVVGRTGAGKSSMIAALFQLYEIEGSTIIDGIDTKQLPLEQLRKKISIIPQDPVLFSGTIRRNLDPFDEYNDDILWNALEQVELKQIISEIPKNLFGNVAENGSNFSIGQKQLICLARAIVRNNKILVMDEATANVDAYTDNLIQKTIREKFADCTVITIAHRLHTIMDSDKVFVIDDGKVMEFDHPYSLLLNKNSIFYAMVQATGTSASKNLYNIAEYNFKKR